MTVDGNGFGIWIRDAGWISLKLALAFALTLPIGLHRQTSHAGIGLRTFPLAATASCAYVLLALAAFPHAEEAGPGSFRG